MMTIPTKEKKTMIAPKQMSAIHGPSPYIPYPFSATHALRSACDVVALYAVIQTVPNPACWKYPAVELSRAPDCSGL